MSEPGSPVPAHIPLSCHRCGKPAITPTVSTTVGSVITRSWWRFADGDRLPESGGIACPACGCALSDVISDSTTAF